MIEIDILNKNTNKRFVKKFNSPINAWKFIRKIKYSNNLEIVCITDYTCYFD